MTSHTGRSGLWRARAAVLLLALISAALLVLSVSGGRLASAQTPPQIDPWAWGRNAEGELGNGTTNVTANLNPVQVSNLTDVVTAAGGGLHSLAIKSDGTGDSTSNDGTVYAWGNNFNGQLGDGTSGSGTNKTTPVQVSGLTDVVAVAGGNSHSLAIKSDGAGDGSADDGTVYTWGANNFGQLGYDPEPTTPTTFENSHTPVQVSGLTDVVAVAGGTFHSLALKSDGTLWAWGNNDVGQLGNGESGSGVVSNTPVQVEDPSDPTGFFTDVVAVAAGSNHSLAIKSDGTDDGSADDGIVYAWGFNSEGQLGDGTSGSPTNNKSTPAQASGLMDVTEVAGGNAHSLALESNGTVYTWGSNSKGQLGHDPNPATSGFEPSSTPSQVSGLTNVEDVASGLNHNLATKSTHGAVWAWGCNDYGQLGNNGVPTNPGSNCAPFSRTPVQTIGLFNAAEVAGGGSHSLALANSETIAPTTTVTALPTSNANGWNNSDVTVSLSATDTGGSDVKEITYSATGAQATPSSTVSGDSATFGIDAEGETTLTCSAKDNAGNTEVAQNLTVKLDKTDPTGSMAINNGKARTRKRSVMLTLDANDPIPGAGVAVSGVTEMRISNSQSGLQTAAWRAYATSVPWKLRGGEGTKTVFVQFRDAAGNESAFAKDRIKYLP